MKKLMYILMAAAMVCGAVSCKKNEQPQPDPDPNPVPKPTAVDIGLVVDGHKVLWANCNLGASLPFEYGNYYCWGETEPRQYYLYGVNTYKEIPTDVLPLKNDAANVKLGGKWRMPTKAELDALVALRDNPDYQWTDWTSYVFGGKTMKDDKDNTIVGARILQKSTNNWIFLPAAGQGDPIGPGTDASLFGCYWSSTPRAESYDAYCFWFGLSGDNPADPFATKIMQDLYNNTYLGNSIRPVYVED